MPEKPEKQYAPTPMADKPIPCPACTKGALVPSFGVECGMCQRHSINGIADGIDYVARTKRVAARILRRQGWDRSAVWGWICPRCARVGCASRQPEFEPRTLKPVAALPNCSASQEKNPCHR